MKPALKVITHLGATAIGVALAATLLPRLASSGDTDGSASTSQAHPSSDPANGKKDKKTSGPRGESRSAAFRAAWAALGKEPLTPQDRIRAQRDLLAEWAQVDLAGAIDAYLGEAWDGADWQNSFRSLGQAFIGVFHEQPLESWRVLSRDKMAQQLLGELWVEGNMQKDPGLVFSMLGELPEKTHERALSYIYGRFSTIKSEQREELLAKLATSGTPQQVESWMTMVYQNGPATGDPAALSAKWEAMPTGGERTREMAAWASALRSADAESFAGEWEKVPAEDRGQAARLLLAQVNNRSPALLDVIGHAVEAGEWKALSAGVADKLRGFETDRQALAEWGLTLPPREEVRGIFNLSISEKILNDPSGGREWLEQLPEGDWHREYGFVEMMLGSLWVRGDKAAAQRAIDAITDQRAREEAIKARYDWQLITSQGDMIRVD